MHRRLSAWILALTLAVVPGIALADHNPLHSYQTRVAGFINEVTLAGLFILPLVAGLAIVWVAVGRSIAKAGSGGGSLHEHDDRIKTILGYLIIGESATFFVAIVSYFFK